MPRLPFRSDVGMAGGSTDGFRGVLIPDGVDVPLKFRLFRRGGGFRIEKGNYVRKFEWQM